MTTSTIDATFYLSVLDDDPLLSIHEAARYLGVSKSTVWKKLRQGQIRPTRIIADFRIRRSELNRYIDECEQDRQGARQ